MPSATAEQFQFKAAKTSVERKQVIKEIARNRTKVDLRNINGRVGVGIAMEIVVKLIAPELFDEVLEAVQEYAAGRN